MKIFDVGELHPNTPHLFADLVELLLLIGYNGRSRLHSNDIEYLLINKTLSPDELDEENEADMQVGVSAAKLARRDLQIEDVMLQLSYRVQAFGDWYPFFVVNDAIQITETLSHRHRIYRLLLACSRLRSFGRDAGIPQHWAKAFTKISKIAFQGLAPAAAISRIFDANSEDRHSYYGTDLRQALRVLGKDLGVIDINQKQCDSVSPSGDGGFDLVANLLFDDGATVNFSLLGQCGAQETEWPRKTLEAHSIQMRHYFQIQFDYPCVMMTPICYRNSDGDWTDSAATNGVFLADRGRILSLLQGVENNLNKIIKEEWFSDFENKFNEYSFETNVNV
jgi:hypothetical protein